MIIGKALKYLSASQKAKKGIFTWSNNIKIRRIKGKG
jgi:hypothetical protein